MKRSCPSSTVKLKLGTYTSSEPKTNASTAGSWASHEKEDAALRRERADMATNALADISSVGAAGSNSGVNMAVIGYGYQILGTTSGFLNVSNDDERRMLKEAVDKVAPIPDGNEDTNTGLALQTAYHMIEQQRIDHPNHTFAVVLLSDGEVMIGDSKAFKTARSANKSLNDKEETEKSRQAGTAVAEKLKNDGIRLHCIGMKNYSCSVLSVEIFYCLYCRKYRLYRSGLIVDCHYRDQDSVFGQSCSDIFRVHASGLVYVQVFH